MMMADAEQGEIPSNRQPQNTMGDEKDGFKTSVRPESRSARAVEILDKILRLGRVEAQGIRPVPVEDRTSRRSWNIFTVWFSMNTNILG